MKTFYGSCKTYPYYFQLWKKIGGKKEVLTSGVFKTKKDATESAIHFSGQGKYSNPYKYRVIKRNCKKKRR